jgi:hypothetical protein
MTLFESDCRSVVEEISCVVTHLKGVLRGTISVHLTLSSFYIRLPMATEVSCSPSRSQHLRLRQRLSIVFVHSLTDRGRLSTDIAIPSWFQRLLICPTSTETSGQPELFHAVRLIRQYHCKHFTIHYELFPRSVTIYGSTVLCWTLAAFQFLNPIHSR